MLASPEAPFEALDESIVYAHLDNPHFGRLEDAFDKHGTAPIYDLDKLADCFADIAVALPYTGRKGTFAFVYWALTTHIAARAFRRNKNLPPFNEVDELTVQAGEFEVDWTDEVYKMCMSGEPVRPMKELLGDVGRLAVFASRPDAHWDATLYSREVAQTWPGLEFLVGMFNHIRGGDLYSSMMRSEVTAKYVLDGGQHCEIADFTSVDWNIADVTRKIAPYLQGGNRRMLTATVGRIPSYIAFLREEAKQNWQHLSGIRDEHGEEAYVDSKEWLDFESRFQVLRNRRQLLGMGQAALSGYGMVSGGGWRPHTSGLVVPGNLIDWLSRPDTGEPGAAAAG